MEENNNPLWIARDEDGSLYLYWDTPEQAKDDDGKGYFFGYLYEPLNRYLYPELTYENSPKPLIVPND